jgi:hypothetical protein
MAMKPLTDDALNIADTGSNFLLTQIITLWHLFKKMDEAAGKYGKNQPTNITRNKTSEKSVSDLSLDHPAIHLLIMVSRPKAAARLILCPAS